MSNETKKKWLQPGFVIGALILAVAAVGLNAAVNRLQLHFKKQPVELSSDLSNVPTSLGTWVQVSKDEPLDEQMQEALGTQKYIFRDYVDTRIVPKEKIDSLLMKDKSAKERKTELGRLIAKYPSGIMNIAVTFYTGMVDTVAHIPDRCYVADGFEKTANSFPSWDIGKGHAPVTVQLANYEDQTAAGRISRWVGYFFQVDGKYVADPISVRTELQDLRHTHGYYAKIELMSTHPDSAEAAKVMNDFLANALPEVEKCLPDWDKVENGKQDKPAQVASR